MPGPHDALFHKTFTNVENAAAELRRALPQELASRIDFSSLEVRGSRYCDQALASTESDLLLSATIDGTEALLYVLVEHQSKVSATMPLRLLRYMSGIWEQHLAQRPAARELPPIVPVVLYHGSQGWSAATSLAELLAVPEGVSQALAPYTPLFRFVLHDLSKEDLVALRRAQAPEAVRLVLFLLQRTRKNPNLDEELEPWAEVARPLSEETLALIMSYLLAVSDLDPEPIGRWAERVGLHGKEAYVTAAEKIAQRERAKALNEGRAQGQAEGRVQGQAEGQRQALQRLLARRFGELPLSALRKLELASVEQLDTWLSRVLDANSLDELLG